MMTRISYPMNILLADDGSPHAQAAAMLLSQLPLPLGSHIYVLAVLLPRESSRHSLLEASLESTSACLDGRGWDVDTELLLGYPSEVLLEQAQALQPDLIVMGAKGLRSTLGVLLGGVAQQIVEYGDWPVLVVRPPYQGLRRISVVVDGSLPSRHAVEYLARFPLPLKAHMQAVHVLPPEITTDLFIQSLHIGPEMIAPIHLHEMEELAQQQAEEEQQEGRRVLAETVTQLESGGYQAEEKLLRGDAATEILQYARQDEVDLLVAGSRGLSPVKGWLLGSVSRKLLHYAHCSVMIIKSFPQ